MMHTQMIRPHLSPVTVILAVLGFLLWWPLGLAMLAYVAWGEMFGGSSEKAERFVHRSRNWAENCGRNGGPFRQNGFAGRSSGNAAFDEYRAEQLRKLEEERKRLDDEIDAFHEYMRNLRMARDREEFDRFMRDKNAPRGYGSGSGPTV